MLTTAHDPAGLALSSFTAWERIRAPVAPNGWPSAVEPPLGFIRSTGKPLARWQEENGGGIGPDVALHPAILQPALGTLRERTERRFTHMIDEGAAEEVRALLARRLSPDLPVMRAIGVREVAGWITGAWSREEAEQRGQRATWQYARRQLTWLRGQPPADWPRIEEDNFDECKLFASLLL